MASLLRQIVAGPRARHPEAGLDLCYVTDRIIATSGPSGTYPKRYYRNPLDQLVAFLDKKHKDNWAIWEFRAEGTGYPDDEVYGRIWHYPWPDHHPPPFGLLPDCLASMRDWLAGNEDRVVVVHCKAGKGRSGTASCSYLMAEEGWKMDDAVKRFTERRMKPGWGHGVSIPSQLRTLRYVDRWTKNGKKYVERRVEVKEIHVWGLRDGVRVAVRGFVEEGKVIKTWHTFSDSERTMMRGRVRSLGFAEAFMDVVGREVGRDKPNGKPKEGNPPANLTNSPKILSDENLVQSPGPESRSETPRNEVPRMAHVATAATAAAAAASPATASTPSDPSTDSGKSKQSESASTSDGVTDNKRASTQFYDAPTTQQPSRTGADAIFKPTIPIVLDTNDINVAAERRTKGSYTWAVTTSVAHVWFNTFFEGQGPENGGKPEDSGVFEIEWDKMDGIKGSSRKGAAAFDKISVVWQAVETRGVVEEPGPGEKVEQKAPADWRQEHGVEQSSDEEDGGVKAHHVQE